MLGTYTVATMVTHCDNQIEEIACHLEKFNALAFNRNVIRAGAIAYSQVTGGNIAGLEDVAMSLKFAIAKACGLMRAAKHFAPDIKLAVRTAVPKLEQPIRLLTEVTFLDRETDPFPPRKGHRFEAVSRQRRLHERIGPGNGLPQLP